jgi:hypothetical protein
MGHSLYLPYSSQIASPGADIFGRDMMFGIPYLADWKEIGDFRHRQTDHNTAQ